MLSSSDIENIESIDYRSKDLAKLKQFTVAETIELFHHLEICASHVTTLPKTIESVFPKCYASEEKMKETVEKIKKIISVLEKDECCNTVQVQGKSSAPVQE